MVPTIINYYVHDDKASSMVEGTYAACAGNGNCQRAVFRLLLGLCR